MVHVIAFHCHSLTDHSLHLQARLVASEKQVKNLEWESEVLQQRFSKIQVCDKVASGYSATQVFGRRTLTLGMSF